MSPKTSFRFVIDPLMRQFNLLHAGPEDGPIDRQPFYEPEDACAWLDLPVDVLEHLPVVDSLALSEPQPSAS